MKKTAFIIYICIVMTLCAMPFALMGVHKTDRTSENKELAELPKFTNENGGVNLEYLSGLGTYFQDRFAFRQELVSLNSTLNAKILNTSTVEDVIKGRNGWLYYSATLDDYRHDNSVSERMLYNMAHNTKLLQDYCYNRGIKFVFTIAPNKNSLYGENMPSVYKYKLAPQSDAERLAPMLDSEGVNYVDMFELFKNEDEVLYYKRDSHWNNKGAVLAYNALLDRAEVEHRTYEDVKPKVIHDYVGDLNRMLYADLAVPEKDYEFREIFPFAYINPDSTVEDNTIETICPSAEGNLLMYRDSFGNTLLPYMATSFENAYFSKIVPYPLSDTEIINPDVLIVEKVERHLPTLAKVPPQMEAPEVSSEFGEIKDGGTVSIEKSNEAGFLKISGELSDKDIDFDSPICVQLKGTESTKVYDAFTVSSDESDYLFCVYLYPETAENCEISVLGIRNGEAVLFSQK